MDKEILKMRAQLYRKIETISVDIGKLKKDGKNSSQGFTFITHEAMTTALRGMLYKHNLSITMQVTHSEESSTETTNKYGKVNIVVRTVVHGLFDIVDTETGYMEQKPFHGADQDFTGKSMQQAITQCMKYFLFKLFKVTDQETDSDFKSVEVTPPAPKDEKMPLAGFIKLLTACKSKSAIKKMWDNIPKEKRPDGGFELCVERADEVAKITKWNATSSDGKKTYIVTNSIESGWNCTCPAVKECRHIKLQKPIS